MRMRKQRSYTNVRHKKKIRTYYIMYKYMHVSTTTLITVAHIYHVQHYYIILRYMRITAGISLIGVIIIYKGIMHLCFTDSWKAI